MTTLAALKAHLRVDHADEDATLTGYLEAATAYLERIGVDMTPDPLPAPVGQMVLLMAGDLYQNREASLERPAHGNPAADRLIVAYRTFAP